MLEQTHSGQQLLGAQLQQLDAKQTAALTTNKTTFIEPPIATDLPPSNYADDNFLADLSWTFNQSGTLNFHQNSIDPKALVNLHEFLRRLIDRGFTGDAVISIYVGNFCVVIDNFGVAQLPPAVGTLGSCMLSSEIYGLDRVAEQYQQDIESALYGLTRNTINAINVIVKTTIDTASYPERLPTVMIKEWNSIAQRNNRIELQLKTAQLP